MYGYNAVQTYMTILNREEEKAQKRKAVGDSSSNPGKRNEEDMVSLYAHPHVHLNERLPVTLNGSHA